jgi:hypothetical protein
MLELFSPTFVKFATVWLPSGVEFVDRSHVHPELQLFGNATYQKLAPFLESIVVWGHPAGNTLGQL